MTNGLSEQTAVGTLNPGSLYPLQFEPIYQHRLWGSRRLGNLTTASLTDDRPIWEPS